jgi:hypothetical protein
VYGSGSGQQQSVAEAVYPGGQQNQPAIQKTGQQSVTQNVYQVPKPPAVKVTDPPPFHFREKGSLQVPVTADAPAEMVLNAAEGVPETVIVEIFYAGAKVAEVRGGQVIYAVPFTVVSSGQLEIRLSGRGKLENAKLHFEEGLT